MKKKNKELKGLRLFYFVMKQTHMLPIIGGFIIYFFIMATIIFFTSNTSVTQYSNIENYGDALWFSFASVFTIGYGDIWVSGVVGRILTVLLVIYGVFIIAIIPAVFLTFYQEKMNQKFNSSASYLLDKLEHLEELSKEELKNLSSDIKNYRRRKEMKREVKEENTN